MASCTTPQWGNSYAPQLRLTVTKDDANSDGAKIVYSWKLEYVAHGYAVSTSYSKEYTAIINGKTVASGSYAINGKTGTSTIKSGTVTINRTTSAQTINYSCSMVFNVTWNGTYGGTKSASGSVTVAAKPSYTISYNANGGSGAPSSQTKWYGTNITLSSTKPTRPGYIFKGWATSSTGSVAYASGATYSSNASVTLYAVWSIITYTISYNANGGSGAPSSQTKNYGTNITLSSTKPIRDGYTFKGWATSSTGSVTYASGATYSSNASITLYAVWEIAYIKPRVNNLNAYRCASSSDGTYDDAGTNIRVIFSWSTDKTVSSIVIYWKQSSSSSWSNSKTVSTSGTSGSVDTIVGSNAINNEVAYDIRVVVTDSGGNSSSDKTVSSKVYLFDFPDNGDGIAIGKAAELEKYLDVGYNAMFRSKAIFSDDIEGRGDIACGSENASAVAGLDTKWQDGNKHYMVERASDGLTCNIGWEGSSTYKTVSQLQGQTVKYKNSSGATTLSDERLKKDFESLDRWADFYDKINPVAFRMKNGVSNRYHMGFKAQQVEESLIDSGLSTLDFGGLIKMVYNPDDKSTDKELYESAGIKPGDDEYGLIYTEFIALNVYMIQSLQKEVRELKETIKRLTSGQDSNNSDN